MSKRAWILNLSPMAIAAALIIGSAVYALAYDRQSNNEKGVRVDVLPVELVEGRSVSFEVRLNTHSVDLDQDMANVSSLKDSMGNTFQPTGWVGSPPGGHHRSGTLTFPTLPPDTETVTLVIKGVGKDSERIFSWQVQP
jgi:hypothetical protein